jgi:hypothetical protein
MILVRLNTNYSRSDKKLQKSERFSMASVQSIKKLQHRPSFRDITNDQ